MPAFALAALRNWKLIGIGLMALLLAVQTVRLSSAKNTIERREIDIRELRGELERISSIKNEQGIRTGENIKEAETIRAEAEGEATKIEQAPLPGNCATPPEIMRSDDI
jgi:hypothetical protein